MSYKEQPDSYNKTISTRSTTVLNGYAPFNLTINTTAITAVTGRKFVVPLDANQYGAPSILQDILYFDDLNTGFGPLVAANPSNYRIIFNSGFVAETVTSAYNYAGTVWRVNGLWPAAANGAPFTIISKDYFAGIDTYKIVYDFGDGEVLTKTSSLDNNFDVANIPVSHTYYLDSNEFTKTFTLTISFYNYGNATPNVYTCTLNVYAPRLESNTLGASGYFDEVQLVGSRMFGPNNDILYIFESINPNYIIPTMVNWKERPAEPIFARLIGEHYRPYTLLAPFEYELTNPVTTTTTLETDPIGIASGGLENFDDQSVKKS